MLDVEILVQGAIIDSWLEPAGDIRLGSRLVLQVAPRGRPKDLVIVEADSALVGDDGWIQDLGENLCHGSPVAAVVRPTRAGQLCATKLQIAR